MESMTAQIASSSSSSPPLPLWKHEVFLSFYGDDTRKGFTDHLYHDLKRKGILAFRDDEKLPRGKYVTAELLRAIQESIYAVVVISPRYAFSTFCLIELAEIIKCMRYNRLIVFPVFYHVKPSDLQNLRGTFAEAFDKHDKDPTVDAEKKQTWRDALKNVSTIAGWPVTDGHEATVVEQITRRIFSELIRRFSIKSRELVGIEARVEEMMKLLGIGSDEQDVRFIGIHGMGGVGKTTLAKVIFDRVSYHFEASSFIGCIREEAKKQGLGSLRKQLLSEIMEEEMGIRFNAHVGLNVIENRLRNKQVLIVLDDVDGSEQIEALACSQEWFGPGSRIILTSKDNQLLKTHGVKDIYSYKVQEMGAEEALQLFCLSAFKELHPKEKYKDLCKDFVRYAQGLPLALKVVGRYLFQKTVVVWRSALKNFEENPPREVLEVLQVSFDGLDDTQQNLFLDIACFFKGEVLDSLQDILESFGYHPLYNIEVLIDRSLITISSDRVIKMHDLLQEMGRKIVCHQKMPGMRTRLWRFEDVLHVLKTDSGTDLIEGIVLHFSFPNKERLSIEAFSKMKSLRLLKIGNTSIAKPYSELHQELRIVEWLGDPSKSMTTTRLSLLEWFGYPKISMPISWDLLGNLVELSMPCSGIERLWDGSKSLGSLKRINLSGSQNLIEIPDFTGVPKLEILDLEGCSSLSKIDQSIGVLIKLKRLNLHNCRSLESLPVEISSESLEEFRLSGCTKLEEFPNIVGSATSLKFLYLKRTAIKILPISFRNLSGLRILSSIDRKNPALLEDAIWELSCLEDM